MTSNYEDSPKPGGSRSLKWSAIGLAGKHGTVAVFALVLARLLGPDAYGLVAQATIYITLTTLLLDQGIAAALMSERAVHRPVLGAAITLNMLLAVVLGGLTVGIAPGVAGFFGEPNLTPVLSVLGIGLLFKGAAIVPRMMLGRSLNFKAIALCDLTGAIAGGVLGISLAIGGADYWSLVGQNLAMDVVAAILYIAFAHPPAPNLQVRLIRPLLGFSSRVFGSNLLSYAAGNSDSILIGRYLGASALATYDVAYRFLRLPVDMTSQILSRVLFPLVAGKMHRGEAVAPIVFRSVRGVSYLTFPLMALVGAAAPQLVAVVLGSEWTAAVPILVVFALSGARQSITTINTPVMLGLGQAGAQLRFSIIAAVIQVSAIGLGLQWGALGVAVSYTVAGF
ncbi:MAG: lipopolysaccharide biosynthesis protein, partial [Marmoricola sp.]|nr:lipopolysaccharide biosynthesis protein [Marmoricola sp.]